MAEQAQQQGNLAAGRGGGAAGRGRGNRGAIPNAPGATMLLNPERAPALITKWQKLLGKDLDEIRVSYKADGVSVELFGMEGTTFHKTDSDDEPIGISIAEYKRLKSEEQAPSSEEAIFAFRNKFEVRLNQEFPEELDLGDGSEASIRSAVQSLPFHQRRVMLMSNKQFKSAYPNGFAGAAGAAA